MKCFQIFILIFHYLKVSLFMLLYIYIHIHMIVYMLYINDYIYNIHIALNPQENVLVQIYLNFLLFIFIIPQKPC